MKKNVTSFPLIEFNIWFKCSLFSNNSCNCALFSRSLYVSICFSIKFLSKFNISKLSFEPANKLLKRINYQNENILINFFKRVKNITKTVKILIIIIKVFPYTFGLKCKAFINWLIDLLLFDSAELHVGVR